GAAGLGRVAQGADAAPVGERARRRRARVRGAHLESAPQDRTRPHAAEAPRHRARPGLQARPCVSFFGARYPIVQAPMANAQPPTVAAAAASAGALGTVAGAALSPDELRAALREVRAATDGVFGVNVFAPPYLRDGALDVVVAERPAFFSFTFGLVD